MVKNFEIGYIINGCNKIEYPGAWYHIMNRGGRYEVIFEDKIDYSVFQGLLQETIDIFHIKVSAFA